MDISLVMTANGAEVRDGNLYALGMGWNWCQSPTPPFTLVVCTLIPEARTTAGPVEWTVILEDADGQPLATMTTDGGLLEASLSPGTRGSGVEIPFWTLLPFGSMELPAGRYTFRVRCDDAERTFAIRVVSNDGHG